ncbi:hypothetical protein FWD20_03185 [Candidatus Saccharibacteria bacterium]|nr:hypothetical protein [Candidatus Saccharibacteria bacterium]
MESGIHEPDGSVMSGVTSEELIAAANGKGSIEGVSSEQVRAEINRRVRNRTLGKASATTMRVVAVGYEPPRHRSRKRSRPPEPDWLRYDLW